MKTKEYTDRTRWAYNADVAGEVDLWGRVVEFELGYRAEYCMIMKLYLGATHSQARLDLEKV